MEPFWLVRDEGNAVAFLDQIYTLKASGSATGGSFGLVEVTTPKGSGPPLHVHSGEDEAFYILEGRYDVMLGGQQVAVETGAFIFAPRNVAHGYIVRSSRGRHLGFVFPSGWETFFHDFVAAGEDPTNRERIAQLARARGVTILSAAPPTSEAAQ